MFSLVGRAGRRVPLALTIKEVVRSAQVLSFMQSRPGESLPNVPETCKLAAALALPNGAGEVTLIVKLCERADLPAEGALKAFHGFGFEICVARSQGLFAFDNRCPHQNAPLSAGTLEGTTVTCPYHAWRFDIALGTAEIAGDPSLQCFEIRQYGEEVFIALPDV